jgi:hypothetical protein
MLGAIAGDIIGSSYEFAGIKTKDFALFSPDSRFTDDTVLTIAVADPGLIFTDDNVIPDLVWISTERLARVLDESGHLVAAPELVVVESPIATTIPLTLN